MNIRKLHRALLLLALLSASSGVGASQQPGPMRACEAAREKARSYLFVSPNTSENLTLDAALHKLDSTEETALIIDGRRIACRLRLKARIVKTIGSWTGGVEHSTMLRVNGDEETVRYADAWLGRRARQKSVLYFQQRAAATGRMYVLSLRGTRRKLALIAKTLDRSSVSDRTLVPGVRRTSVYVVDFKNELRRRVALAARRLGARYRVLEGTGDFIGADARDKAQQVFSEIVSQYEQAHPPVKNNCATETAQSWLSIKQAASVSQF